MSIFKKRTLYHKLLIGRSEWCALPNLHIPAIKAKIDTGAKTSAIHAFNIERYTKHGKPYARFDIHPIQSNEKVIVTAKAPIIDERFIMSSNGHMEHRYVISTALIMGDQRWKIELTLSNRDPLRYRMLLGREALNGRVLIDPNITCHQGKLSKSSVFLKYGMPLIKSSKVT